MLSGPDSDSQLPVPIKTKINVMQFRLNKESVRGKTKIQVVNPVNSLLPFIKKKTTNKEFRGTAQ